MANEVFKITLDDRALRLYAKDLKIKRPSQQRAIVRDVLNDAAFSTGAYSRRRAIPSLFVNRNKWVNSSVLVDKTRAKTDINGMFSLVGARKHWGRRRQGTKPFMGLGEQEDGGKVWGKHVPTLESRKGSFQNKVRPSLTFKQLAPGDTPLPTLDNSNIIGSIRKRLRNHGKKGAFRIKGSPKFKDGVYKFSGKKRRFGRIREKVNPITMIKSEEKQTVNIKAVRWLLLGTRRGATGGVINKAYRRAFKKYTGTFKKYK